jgi:hypothetical protein
MAIRGCLLKRVSDLTAQNYTAGTGTLVFDNAGSEIYDTDGFHSNVTNPSRITIPSAVNGQWGLFTINAALTSYTGTGFYLALWKNGAVAADLLQIGNGGITNTGFNTNAVLLGLPSYPLPLVTNDFWEINVFVGTDTSVTLSAETNFGLFVLDKFSGAQCLCKKAADQTAADYSTPTAIAWDGTDIYDSNNLHDPSSNNTKIIIPSTLNNTYVQLRANVGISDNLTNSDCAIAIKKNGTTIVYDGVGLSSTRSVLSPPAGRAGIGVTTGVFQVVTGDYFEVFYYNNDTSLTIVALQSSFGLICLGS